MALTINEVRRERRVALRDIRRRSRSLDTSVESFQRKLNSILQRQTKVPESADLDKLYQGYVSIKTMLRDLEKSINDSAAIFSMI